MPDTSTLAIRVIRDLREARADVTRRTGFTEAALPPHIVVHNRRVFGADLSAHEVVDRILGDVRHDGDAALRRYTEAFDGRAPDAWEVPLTDAERAWRDLSSDLREAMETAAGRIRDFHQRHVREHWFTTGPTGLYGQLIQPLERVGIYTPSGTAAYPSSLLMSVIPARVAGVEEIILCTPPGRDGVINPLILAAAWIAGVNRIFALGGAQAIAAMAFGTESVPHVDKILGPGNIFVTLAKQRVYGIVGLDQLAGPTETLLIADESADPALTAADMLAQSEHDPLASAILITTSSALVDAVQDELARQLEALPRVEIAQASLETNGRIILVDDLTTAVDLANAYAPEHLCLLVADPWKLVPLVRHAGGIFLGEDSPEALGDYTAGPSHIMPTGGTARFSSPCSVNDFVKVISLIGANQAATSSLADATIALAEAEGLHGHANAIALRRARLDQQE